MRPSARMSRVRSLWELHQTALRACSAHVDPFRLTCSLTPTLMETRAHHTANYMSRLHPVASGGLIALLVIAPFLVSIAAVQALQGRIRETRALVKASRIQERLLRGYIRTVKMPASCFQSESFFNSLLQFASPSTNTLSCFPIHPTGAPPNSNRARIQSG